ncbi:hypothetical protein Pen01_38990 [Phytomonospora endophytica]|nr:hypothetical protein Pen01_38990 [Phytomonospora endophytica]
MRQLGEAGVGPALGPTVFCHTSSVSFVFGGVLPPSDDPCPKLATLAARRWPRIAAPAAASGRRVPGAGGRPSRSRGGAEDAARWEEDAARWEEVRLGETSPSPPVCRGCPARQGRPVDRSHTPRIAALATRRAFHRACRRQWRPGAGGRPSRSRGGAEDAARWEEDAARWEEVRLGETSPSPSPSLSLRRGRA